MALLKVENLETSFYTDFGVVKAADGVSYQIDEREIVGFVGESGCGKSVSMLSTLQLINTPGRIEGGKVTFEGQDLLKYQADAREIRSIRGSKIAMIFQEPMTSLNPTLSVFQQIGEMLKLHLHMDSSAQRERAIELLQQVGIPDAARRLDDYPHQFSGGMRQRVMIAIALSCNPKILIADEPTTALDVTTQMQLLELMKDLVNQYDTSLIIVTHNLGVVARYAQRIYIMYAGRIVEAGTCKDIFKKPRHPYTQGLLHCVPRLDEEEDRRLYSIEGVPPNLIDMPNTCAFLPRCPYAIERCRVEPWPCLEQVDAGHYTRCFVNPGEMQRWHPGGHAARRHHTRQHFRGKTEKDFRSGLHGDDVILDVRNLKVYFPVFRGLLRRKVADVKAVDGVTFHLKKGEVLGLVGESGCGKTTVGRAILRLYKPIEGTIVFEGQDISSIPNSKIGSIRRKMPLIFQDPYGSLDPRQSAGSIVGEPIKVHKLVNNNSEYRERVVDLFRMVGLDPGMAGRMPHEFSGGQRQRIGIARALATNPSLMICDEPISALDVSIQAQVINLLKDLQAQFEGLSYMFIAHDLAVVKHISDRIAVMYLGHIVEVTSSRELYRNPLHPYTKALLSAIPVPDPYIEETRERIVLTGEVPSALNPPSGCVFHRRCAMAIPDCSEVIPELKEVSPDHLAACIRI